MNKKENISFSQQEDKDKNIQEFEIVTMIDDLARSNSDISTTKRKKTLNQISQTGNLSGEALSHKDNHPVLVTFLLLIILGSVITMAVSWWYLIYQPLQLVKQMANKPQEFKNDQAKQIPDQIEPSFVASSKIEDTFNIFFMENSLQIHLNDNEQDFFAKINQESQKINNKNSFIRIKLLNNGSLIKLSDLFHYLNLTLDQNIITYIEGNKYNIFAYIDGNGLIRYGFVSILKESMDNFDSLQQYLKSQEPFFIQIIEKILNPDYDSNNLQNSSNMIFQDGIYKDIKLRYYNFKKENFAFDYAVLTNQRLLLFTTSKDSMFNAIERILQTNSTITSYPQDVLTPVLLTPVNENAIIKDDQNYSL